jgi:hypothetical protein
LGVSGKAAKGSRNRLRTTVGLDEPCRQCGEPIYYNYEGPIAGWCGKCTDRARQEQKARHARRGRRVADPVGGRPGASRRWSRGWFWAAVVLAFGLGALLGLYASQYLPH